MVKVNHIILGICLFVIFAIQNAEAGKDGKSGKGLITRMLSGKKENKKNKTSSNNVSNLSPSKSSKNDDLNLSKTIPPENNNFNSSAIGEEGSIDRNALGYSVDDGAASLLQNGYEAYNGYVEGMQEQDLQRQRENERREYKRSREEESQGLNAILFGKTRDGASLTPGEAVMQHWNNMTGGDQYVQNNNHENDEFPRNGFEEFPNGLQPERIY